LNGSRADFLNGALKDAAGSMDIDYHILSTYGIGILRVVVQANCFALQQ
jgi:hypothetical protein